MWYVWCASGYTTCVAARAVHIGSYVLCIECTYYMPHTTCHEYETIRATIPTMCVICNSYEHHAWNVDYMIVYSL